MLTQSRLKEVLRYNKNTGIFSWRVSRSHNVKAGDIAGTKDKRYLRIKIDGVLYRAHRLAWLYVTGKFPRNEIDHKNGSGIDNRWKNLRDVSRAVNRQNQRLPLPSNILGVQGVRKYRRKYRAVIGVNGKSLFLGLFHSPQEAHAVYVIAKRKLHEGCTL